MADTSSDIDGGPCRVDLRGRAWLVDADGPDRTLLTTLIAQHRQIEAQLERWLDGGREIHPITGHLRRRSFRSRSREEAARSGRVRAWGRGDGADLLKDRGLRVAPTGNISPLVTRLYNAHHPDDPPIAD